MKKHLQTRKKRCTILLQARESKRKQRSERADGQKNGQKTNKLEDKKMLTFRNKNNGKTIALDTDKKAFYYADGSDVKAVNKNGTINPVFKNGLNADGQADKNAIYRVYIDVDENGQKTSYGLENLTAENLAILSGLYLDGARLTVGKRNPEQNGNGEGRTKKAKLAIFELPKTYVQKLFLTEYAQTVEKYGQYINVADTLKLFGDLQATAALFEQAEKDYADTLASIEQKRKDEKASENLFNKFVDLTDEQKAAFLAMLGQKAN